jgi:hypothetical protein
MLTILLLSAVGCTSSINLGITIEVALDYFPIKWAEIVLGGFDYYKHPPGRNAIQKVEHWIQSRGVPYDIIEDDNLEAPTDTPSQGKYPLQYANGTIRYQVIVVLMNNHTDTSAVVNTSYIYWAVGNGTNAVIFGTVAKYVPELLSISPTDVSYFFDTKITQINCTIHKTFNDGIIEYQQGVNQTIDLTYDAHSNVANTEGKTVWYTMHSDTGKNWNGMMNTTYGCGKVFWNTVIPSSGHFLWYSTFYEYWEDRNLKFIAHAINFMFKQVTKLDLGLQGYKKWKGAITYRLDQDWPIGIEKPPEDALKAGWYVDAVICPLGYYANGGELTEGMPTGYTAAPSSNIKHGTWTDLVLSTEPYRVTSRTFIVYTSTVEGNYDRIKVDWNENKNFADDPEFKIWENMTSNITSLMGTYYWGYIDNWKNPTKCGLAWWCPLRERISDFSWWKEMGRQGYIHYGLHSYQHAKLGCSTEVEGAFAYWNGSRFIMNQTWIEQKFTEAKNELAYCLGSTGYGFEADKVLVSQAGNEYKDEVDAALFNLDFVYVTFGDNAKNEPGWFLYNDRVNAMTCGAAMGQPHIPKSFEALKDAVKTLFPIFGIYEHNRGYYNLTFNVYPPDTAYTDMFCFAHLDESFEFWSNARYMWMNTIDAYYKNNKLILEYKANSTLKDYVWRFPVEFDGKYFNGFSDNRTIGKIKHIDGKYIYIEFSEGGCERLEATYGTKPHIYQTSSYIENITQIYTSKNLTLQLWNASGSINIKINCTSLCQPNATKINGNLIDFDYDSITKICSFNVTLNGLTTVELLWTYAPPDPPTFLSPSVAKRFDPNKSVTFSWEFNDPDLDDFQSAYRFQLDDDSSFFSLLIDTGKVSSSYTQTTQTLPDSIGPYYWRIKTWDNRNAEGDWSDPQTIIVDRLKVASKGVTHNRTDVGSPVCVYFNVIRECDNTLFDGTKGTVYINESATTWDETNRYWKLGVTQNSVGRWEYKVSSITDTEHQITTVNDFMGTQEVIWDKLTVTITPEATTVTVGTQVKFTVTAVYAYDNERVPEFTVNILRDGKRFAVNNFTDTCSIEFSHLYTTENITEKTYGLTAFTSNSPTVTWTPKPLIQQLMDWMTSNALILVPIIQIAIILTYLLIREHRKNKKIKQSCH